MGAAMVWGLAAGCDPSDDANGETTMGQDTPFGDTGAGAEEPHCLEEVAEFDYGAVTPAGMSAEELLAGKLGTYATQLQFANEPLSLGAHIRGTTVGVVVELGYAGGDVRYIESTPNPDSPWGGGFNDGALACNSRLEIDAALRLTTDDGAFDEQAQLTIVREYEDVLFGSVRVHEVNGTFDMTTMWNDNSVTEHLSYEVQFAANEISGGIGVQGRGGPDMGGDGGWIFGGVLASWGPLPYAGTDAP